MTKTRTEPTAEGIEQYRKKIADTIDDLHITEDEKQKFYNLGTELVKMTKEGKNKKGNHYTEFLDGILERYSGNKIGMRSNFSLL